MIRLYDNPFSPFTRKVRMVLAYKGIAFESIDALARDRHAELMRVNPRGEVPTIEDDGFVVVDSADIVAYLEDRFPTTPVLPEDARARARARVWQRFGDTVLDAIVHDISIWTWPTHHRQDAAPPGLVEAGRRDLVRAADRIEAALAEGPFVCGPRPSIADFALFPHLSSFRLLGVSLEAQGHERLLAWIRRMRELPCVQEDLAFVKRMAAERFGTGESPYEAEKIVWRGDRLEWLFARGFHAWWIEELRAGRAVVPAWAPA